MQRSRARLLINAAMALLTVFVTPAALAGDNKAPAEALLGEGVKLTSQGKYAEACPKFEASLELYDSINTRYFLADCRERNGKLASAWVDFLEVAEKAHDSGQVSKEKKARERAAALEPKVPKLHVHVLASDTPGLVITRDGFALGRAQWETPLPMDPGEHEIVASAPGRVPLTLHAKLAADGVTSEVTVPQLALVESATAVAPPAADQSSAPPPPTPDAPSSAGRTQRIIGIASGAAGLVTMGVGVALGVSAKAKYQDAPGCEGTVCNDEDGLAARDSARSLGNVGTGLFIGGAVVGAAGAVLYFTAPSAKQSSRGSAPPWYLTASSNRVTLGGSF